jgi:hypothetical protein
MCLVDHHVRVYDTVFHLGARGFANLATDFSVRAFHVDDRDGFRMNDYIFGTHGDNYILNGMVGQDAGNKKNAPFFMGHF